jgi:hypothetical protein
MLEGRWEHLFAWPDLVYCSSLEHLWTWCEAMGGIGWHAVVIQLDRRSGRPLQNNPELLLLGYVEAARFLGGQSFASFRINLGACQDSAGIGCFARLC